MPHILTIDTTIAAASYPVQFPVKLHMASETLTLAHWFRLPPKAKHIPMPKPLSPIPVQS